MAYVIARDRKKKHRNGKPMQSYFVQWRENGIKKTSAKFELKADAERFAAEVELALAEGKAIDTRKQKATMADVFDRMMTSKIRPKGSRRRSEGLSENQRVLYEIHWRLYIEPVLGSRRVGSLRQADIEELLSDLKPIRLEASGDSTREHVYREIRHILNHAVHLRLIASNPAENIHIRPPASRQHRYLRVEEVDALAAAHPDRYRALIYVACWGGPRISEMSYLRLRHLRADRRILIEGAAPYIGGRRVEQLTKSGKTRLVPLPGQIWDELEHHVRSFTNKTEEDPLIFTTNRGAPLAYDNFRSRIFNEAVAAAKLRPKPTIHDMRHTAASLMASAGYRREQVQAILGHSSQYMTDHYTHLFPEDFDASTKLADAAITDSRRRNGRDQDEGS